jgi:hypothetical protein
MEAEFGFWKLKPENRGFESQFDYWIFSVYLMPSAALLPWS